MLDVFNNFMPVLAQKRDFRSKRSVFTARLKVEIVDVCDFQLAIHCDGQKIKFLRSGELEGPY